MAQANCPICGTPGADIDRTVPGYRVRCQVCCGLDHHFVIGPTVMDRFNTTTTLADPETAKLKPYLSAYIRRHRDSSLVLTHENWKSLAEAIQATPVVTKVEKLLSLIADRSSYPGRWIEIEGGLDYPLADAANREELRFMLERLKETGLIAWTEQDRPGFMVNASVLAKGWEKLQATGNKGIPGRCFVAMSFDPKWNDAYDLAIEPAIRECGLDPRRVDRIYHNENINEKILAELREAELVVADFTMQRNGVYFEAGFARGLGREVFWCCQKDDLENLHFDTRQFNFIDWEDYDDLRTRLTNKVKALGFARI